jgi:hypothetical protein
MESDMSMFRRVALALLLGVAAQANFAADAAYDFTVCTAGKRVPLEANADIVAFGVESWGVVSASTTKLFEQASTHCVGYLRIVAGKPVGKGSCKWVLVGGDSGVGEWEYPAAGESTWNWVAGTGRLKGVTGRGTFKEVFSAPVVDPAIGLGCRRDWGTINLP